MSTASTELESQESRARPYVVLEQGPLLGAIEEALEKAAIEVSSDELAALAKAVDGQEIYAEIDRVPSRNAAHALTQVGRRYEAGPTPPLVAVSERMFRPRTVNVTFDPRVSIA